MVRLSHHVYTGKLSRCVFACTTQHSLMALGHDAGDTVSHGLFPVSNVNETLVVWDFFGG